MLAGISSSLSGLAAAQSKINVAANNIANAHSEEFKKTRANLSESSAGGVQVTLETLNTPGSVVLKETGQGLVEQEVSNVDLASEFVDVLSGKHLFEANVQAIKTQDETLGSLLDIRK